MDKFKSMVSLAGNHDYHQAILGPLCVDKAFGSFKFLTGQAKLNKATAEFSKKGGKAGQQIRF